MIEVVNFIEEKCSIMLDLSLIDNLRDLIKLINNRENNISLQKENYLVRYNYSYSRNDLLKLMMGYVFCLENIVLIQIDLFKYSDDDCEVFDEDIYLVLELNYIEYVKKKVREKDLIKMLFVCVCLMMVMCI